MARLTGMRAPGTGKRIPEMRTRAPYHPGRARANTCEVTERQPRPLLGCLGTLAGFLGPRVLQRDGAVEHQLAAGRGVLVDREVARPLELERGADGGLAH